MYVSHFTTSSFCPVTITVPQTPLDLGTNAIEKKMILKLPSQFSFHFSNSLIVLQFTLYTYRITACKSFPFFVPKLHLQFPRKKLEALNFPFKKKSP